MAEHCELLNTALKMMHVVLLGADGAKLVYLHVSHSSKDLDALICDVPGCFLKIKTSQCSRGECF